LTFKYKIVGTDESIARYFYYEVHQPASCTAIFQQGLKQSIIKMVFWYVKPCSLIDIYQSFEGKCCLIFIMESMQCGKNGMDLGQEPRVGL
jgi:hypothetical protein